LFVIMMKDGAYDIRKVEEGEHFIMGCGHKDAGHTHLVANMKDPEQAKEADANKNIQVRCCPICIGLDKGALMAVRTI